MKLSGVFVFLCICVSVPGLHGQSPVQFSDEIFLIPQGYVHAQLDGDGPNGVLHTTAANIGASNPAALFDHTETTVGVSFQFESPIDDFLLEDARLQRPKGHALQSIGLVLPLGQFRLGAGYYEKYTKEMILPPFEIFTPEQPGGTGEFLVIKSEEFISSFAVIIAAGRSGIIIDGDRFDAGAEIQIDKWVMEYSIGPPGASLKSEQNLASSFGVRYTYQIRNNGVILIGVQYSPRTRVEGRIDGRIRLISPEGEDVTQYTFYAKVPSVLRLGLELQLADGSAIWGALTQTAWSVQESADDQLDTAIGLIKQFHGGLSASVGAYTSKYSSRRLLVDVGEINATYYFGGAAVQIGSVKLDVHFSQASSKSSDRRKQTILKLGVGFTL